MIVTHPSGFSNVSESILIHIYIHTYIYIYLYVFIYMYVCSISHLDSNPLRGYEHRQS